MQQTVVKFIALLYRYCTTCYGHYTPHHLEPVKPPLQPLVPYECAGGSVHSRGWFVSNKPTMAENTSTPTFMRKPEAATAV
jgi:hypothetical protein